MANYVLTLALKTELWHKHIFSDNYPTSKIQKRISIMLNINNKRSIFLKRDRPFCFFIISNLESEPLTTKVASVLA
ncbi:hypothetical protein EPT53_06685 [Fusobacterium necrophorum]|uniref:Uncharacterized protein n=1 Tax=Fusobacterium necrophorum TaxID=859 RepID=A0A4Q2KV33_9FUSO|nr:hypothetical protein [Fusobacterium necrophorum]RXZ69418.1 hypothetical protein EPT53_06685 [Fusobacterium necrophorum]